MDNEPVILYGIGQKTGEIIPEMNVLGLMDETQTGAYFYGKKVLSYDEVATSGVRKIIIVARRANTRIIYRRIADFCQKNNIAVYDVDGNSYPEKTAGFNFSKYSEISREKLCLTIKAADTVSFDIFDTLLIRTVLYPEDVFYLFGEAFAKARIAAERAFYAEGKYPDIYEIYKELTAFPITAEDEIAAEKSVLRARTEMVDILSFAKKIGKKIFLTSDMYYPKKIMKDLLSGCGIKISENDILVSSDIGKSKANGLFEELIKKSGGGRILHIGDSYEGDILSAKKSGIDDTFFIPSIAEMLEDSYVGELLQFAKTLPDRKMIGVFAANALRDPFLFSKTGGKFRLSSLDCAAYTFIAPVVLKSFCEMIKIAENEGVETILLGARDGYLFSEIYQKLSPHLKMPKMYYFLISRALAVCAALKTEDDIKEAMNLPWNGNAEGLIKTRFKIAEPKTRNPDETDTEYILRHSDEILSVAKKTRLKYLSYVSKFDLQKNQKIGFFDLASSGTCQKALAAITDFDLTGIYIFAVRHNNGYKSEVPVKGIFGTVDPYKKNSYLFDNYLLLENILMSDDPTIADFDESGNPIFLTDERTGSQLKSLSAIQGGTLKYCTESGLNFADCIQIDKNIPDIIYSMVGESHQIDETGYFKSEMMYDEFTNRTFGVT
jgi:HAD superfamily hydrolase (TIGR01549 family)